MVLFTINNFYNNTDTLYNIIFCARHVASMEAQQRRVLLAWGRLATRLLAGWEVRPPRPHRGRRPRCRRIRRLAPEPEDVPWPNRLAPEPEDVPWPTL